MILSNIEILRAIKEGAIRIGDLSGKEDPELDPFNTTSVDLHLGDEIRLPKAGGPFALDLTKKGISEFLKNTRKRNA